MNEGSVATLFCVRSNRASRERTSHAEQCKVLADLLAIQIRLAYWFTFWLSISVRRYCRFHLYRTMDVRWVQLWNLDSKEQMPAFTDVAAVAAAVAEVVALADGLEG